MNLHHLLVFHTVARTGSITASSRELHISQPALSRELRDLEERLGVILFDRQPRGMRLTGAGQVLALHAERLFAIADTAERDMKALAAARSGHLALAASNTVGTYVLPQLMASFRSANPDVTITLFVGNTREVAQGVADWRYALGFIEGPLHTKGLISTPFRYDELLPVVPPSHHLARHACLLPEQLADEALLMRERGSGTRELIEDLFCALGIRAGPVMEFSNAEALKQAALHGAGVGWLPALSIQHELASGTLVPLRAPSLTIRRPLSMVRRESAAPAPAETLFMHQMSA